MAKRNSNKSKESIQKEVIKKEEIKKVEVKKEEIKKKDNKKPIKDKRKIINPYDYPITIMVGSKPLTIQPHKSVEV